MKKSLLLSLIFITVLIVFANSSKLHSKKSRKADKTTTKEKAEKKAEKKAEPNYTKYEYPKKDCSQENCYGGKCNDDKSVCYCLKEFSSYEERIGEACSYARYYQLPVFLIELFIGCGIGHLYLLRIATGICKLLLAAIPGIIKILDYFINGDSKERSGIWYILLIIAKIMGVAYGIWWFVDLFLFGLRKYKDGNGVTLIPW